MKNGGEEEWKSTVNGRNDERKITLTNGRGRGGECGNEKKD